ncbi:hypothetical protein DSO57_1021171 [Entomophthora muscae]|uniref:Uncharacterized protein n=1 Tax=Entomophthora muscae TaxID=34485 RepID=A0ACC2SGT8_9FUNG|nr:hypothetical protein DSO57_1021171 [Entomophthora muscae]
MVCRAQVNCNTGKSLYELVYGKKPNLVITTVGPCLPLPKKVPDNSDPDVQSARKDQEDMEKKRIESVVNVIIHHVLILPSMSYFKDKYLSFAFAPQNESGSK